MIHHTRGTIPRVSANNGTGSVICHDDDDDDESCDFLKGCEYA